jgi:filamentous hemagglutinin family protein
VSVATLTAYLTFVGSHDALSQSITLDGTLGLSGTLTGPDYLIPQNVGRTVDSNLFHSFGQFNLNTGESAGFQSAANIRNIFARVTGGSASFIDGLIFTTSPRVNLIFINPSGIVFGANAALDVGSATRGSFVATTIDALVWPNGGQFSATNPGDASSLLTIVGDPSGFLSSQRPLQPVEVRSPSGDFSVYPGQSLVLLGGDIQLDGAVLRASRGRIELGGVAAEGTDAFSISKIRQTAEGIRIFMCQWRWRRDNSPVGHIGNPISQPITGHQGDVISVAFSPDGKTIVSVGAHRYRCAPSVYKLLIAKHNFA